MWVGYMDGDQISYTPQKQTQLVGSVCRASPESNCCSETNLAAHAGWSKPLPPPYFLLSIHPSLPPFPFLSLQFSSSRALLFGRHSETEGEGGRKGWESLGMRRGKKMGKGSLLSEIMLWISLERPGVFGLAWRLADDRGRWSWKRVINKHFNRAGERCRQASGHGPSLGSLAPLQVTLHE